MENVILYIRSLEFRMFKKKRKLYQKIMKLFAIIKYALNKWTIHAVLIWTFLCFFRFYMVTGCKFAFSNDLKIRFGTPCIIQISLTLSILCVTHQSSINQTAPIFFHSHKPNTKKHSKKTKKQRYILETSSFPCSESETITEIMDNYHSIDLSERLAQTTKLFHLVLVLHFSVWSWIPVVLFKATVLVICFFFFFFH